MELFAKRTFDIDTENAFKMGSRIALLEHQGNSIIKLNLGEPDFKTPDFIKEEIKKQIDNDHTHYCDSKGLLTLRTAICDQIFKTRHLSVSPEQVVVFPGSKPSIGFSQQVYCNPGDEIIYPSPGYPIYESFTRYLGAIPVPAHLKEEEGFIFKAEHLAELITPKTKLIFLNFPSNPTGGVASQKQLEEMSQIILKKCSPEVRIYSDEIYEHIIFDGQKHHSIASIPEMAKRTIISSGFSKSYSWTGGRVGYAVFPTIEEADVFKNLNINYFSCISAYNQEAARVALEHPDSPKIVLDMVRQFENRRNIVLEQLKSIPNISCQKPGGAFYFFLNIQKACQFLGAIDLYKQLEETIRKKTTPSTLVQLFALYQHHVAVLDRKSFGKIGSEHEHYLRLSAAQDIPILKEGLSRLAAALQDKEGFQKFVQKRENLY